ncbi:MAG: uracil-DNA glycosylase, partial [Caulobacteraceae bacterium]
ALPRLKAILALGEVARRNVLKALGFPASAGPRGHGAVVKAGPYTLVSSYHCSRLNTNTGRLTPAMFQAAVIAARTAIEARP